MAVLFGTEKNPLWLGGDVLYLSMNFTSQYLKDNTKRLDNHEVVFISVWYKTGDPPATDKDNRIDEN